MIQALDRPISIAEADFAQAYVDNGGNATAALRAARPDDTSPGLPAMAARMLERPQVLLEIDRLRTAGRRYRKLTTGRKREILHDFAEDEDLEPKTRMDAIMHDGKYAGDYAPVAVALDVASDQLSGIFARVSAGGYKLDEMGEIIEAEPRLEPVRDYSHLLD